MQKINEYAIIDTNTILNNVEVIIIEATYNKEITEKLVFGAIDVFKKYNVKNIQWFKVPGAFEIPFLLKRIVSTIDNNKNKIYFCVGCLIEGESDHYDSTRIATVNSLSQLSISNEGLCVINCVLNVKNKLQALQRCGVELWNGKKINVGSDYAHGACQLVLGNKNLFKND